MRKDVRHGPQLLRFSSPAGTDRPKHLVRRPQPLAARNQLWRIAGCGLSAVGTRPTAREFHHRQLSSDSQKTRVEKAITESAQSRAALAAREGWLVARTRFSLSSDALLMNVFCYPDVTRRREVCRILGFEPGSVPVWIHAAYSVTQRSDRED